MVLGADAVVLVPFVLVLDVAPVASGVVVPSWYFLGRPRPRGMPAGGDDVGMSGAARADFGFGVGVGAGTAGGFERYRDSNNGVCSAPGADTGVGVDDLASPGAGDGCNFTSAVGATKLGCVEGGCVFAIAAGAGAG